jgi:hypothetical protein
MNRFKHTTSPINATTPRVTVIVFETSSAMAVIKAAAALPHLNPETFVEASPGVFFVTLTA